MKKLKLALLTIAGLNLLLTINAHAEIKNNKIIFSDDYFGSNTHILSGNYSEITFNDEGNDGFGLFFIGEGIKLGEGVELNINDNPIKCYKQINGYYSTNFTDFGIFPLDPETLDKVGDQQGTRGVSFITGGLYYDCDNKPQNKVYGYIKWTYGINGENTHEIRAGLNDAGDDRAEISPLELVYSTNNRNNARTMSGHFINSLTKGSDVTPTFVGDIGILGGPQGVVYPNGTNYILEASDYNDNKYKLYIKSSLATSTVTVKLITGQNNQTILINNEPLSNEATLYGFYGYKEIVLTGGMTTNSGIIQVTLNDTISTTTVTVTMTITFQMDDNNPPTITIDPINNQCTEYKTVIGHTNKGTLYYHTGTTTTCDGTISDINFTQYEGPLRFNQESDSGTYVCFKAVSNGGTSYKTSTIITGIDTIPPSITNVSFQTGTNPPISINNNTEPQIIYECESATIKIEGTTITGCAILDNIGRKTGTNSRGLGNSLQYSITSNEVTPEPIVVHFSVNDKIGQSSTGQVSIIRQDKKLSGKTSYASTGSLENNNSISFTSIQLKNYFEITGYGTCETISIITGDCSDSLRQKYQSNKLTITPINLIEDEPNRCIIYFTDGDTTITGTISFPIKTDNNYITLKNDWPQSTSQGMVRYEGDDNFDENLVKLTLKDGDGHNLEGDITDRYNILSVRNTDATNNPKMRYSSMPIEIKFDGISIDKLDEKYKYPQCKSGTFTIVFEEGFVKDPAGIPSAKTEILTDNIYKNRPIIHVLGINKEYIEGNTKEVLKQSLISGDVELTLYTTREIPENDNVECIATETCPGFSCTSGINNRNTAKLSDSIANQLLEEYGVPYKFKYTFKLDPMEDLGAYEGIFSGDRIEFNGCKVKLKERHCYEYDTINLLITTKPYKFGEFGSEYFYDGPLGEAIDAGSGDYGFFMYMSNPQYIQVGESTGVLGSIDYDISFSSGVADEFYHIQGTGIVNGYEESLEIQRPTYNYKNPKGYLFNFPYYADEDY